MSFIQRVRDFFKREAHSVEDTIASVQLQVKTLGLAAAARQDEALVQQAIINAATKAKAIAEADMQKAKDAAVAVVNLVNALAAVKQAV